MNELNIKLDVFEGPLDLLLHLIKTLEIDIYDIPIAKITEQYMIFIRSMKELDLELAGEYIVMAATLMSIKSKLLLPKVEVDFEESDYLNEEDPRDQLVAQLLEYRKYKYAAGVLKDKEAERGKYYTKEATNLDEYKDAVEPLAPNEVTMIDLYLAFSDVLNRQKELEPTMTSISAEEYSIDDKINEIMKKMFDLNDAQGLDFSSLFYVYTRHEIVTTFMALLELMKSGEVLVKQARSTEPMILYRKNEIKEDSYESL